MQTLVRVTHLVRVYNNLFYFIRPVIIGLEVHITHSYFHFHVNRQRGPIIDSEMRDSTTHAYTCNERNSAVVPRKPLLFSTRTPGSFTCTEDRNSTRDRQLYVPSEGRHSPKCECRVPGKWADCTLFNTAE